ncbi:MAG: hypothetical protein KF858_01005 [Candidatus Sumerlaeia bacterium]|nr:hypothetical protein [Candidatus Sumerlaeia bacterium]
MSDLSVSTPPPRRMSRGLKAFLILVIVVIGLPCATIVGCQAWKHIGPMIRGAVGEHRAQQVFGPALERLTPVPEPYDIDKTIRVIHALDLALDNRTDLREYLDTIARQDFRGVAPEVLEARARMLEQLKHLYALSAEEKDHQLLFAKYRRLFLSAITSIEGDLGFGIGVGFDSNVARQRLERLDAEEDKQRTIRKEIRAVEQQLLDALVGYSEVYYKYLEEWDRVCLARDRAYLAVADRQWDKAIEAAERTAELAPFDNEAVLLRAMALLESQPPQEGPASESTDTARRLLAATIDANPDRTAPALLLLGVAEREAGNFNEARLLLDQAAAYYPRQAEYLTDRVDAYRMRAFLRKSREGRRVLELYKSTMLGAGYFSPDLQLARLHRDQGSHDAMREKVLDHFSRRRAQRQLDYLISDLDFCTEFLGIDYFKIFPEEFYLDLEYTTTLMGFGDAISLNVTNRSDRTLHNATLVLCIHFTDMVRGDYETFLAPKTATVVQPGQKTDFGRLNIRFDLYGIRKGVRDIVECRAILISNEAVVWVDTDAYKLARLSQTLPAPPVQEQADQLADMLSSDTLAKLREAVVTASGNRSGDLRLRLPKEIALLRPIFRLATEDREQLLAPVENLIQDGDIRLRFDRVPGGARAPRLSLLVNTPYGRYQLGLKNDGSGNYRITIDPEGAVPTPEPQSPQGP